MKKIFKILVAMFMAVSFLQANSLNQTNQVDGYDVELTSKRELSAGSNEIYAKVSKDGKALSDTKVKIKFFMPEMPGMPYMEHDSVGSLDGDRYKIIANFCMNGTWQYHFKFKSDDGVIHTLKSSVNF